MGSLSQQPKPLVGGQALFEGVMMRYAQRSPRAGTGSAQRWVAVVRRSNGTFATKAARISVPTTGVGSWPLLRGLSALAGGLRAGQQALRFSAEIYAKDATQEGAASEAKPSGTIGSLLGLAWAITGDVPEALVETEAPTSKPGWFVLPTFAFTLLLVVLPQLLVGLLVWLFGAELSITGPAFQLLTGAAILSIIVSYVLGIRQFRDVYRVFQYHGAEHKTVHAFERELPLTVAAAKPMPTLHPRCGTTFLVFLALLAVAGYIGVGAILGSTAGFSASGPVAQHLIFMGAKLLALPLVAGVAFELQRVLARLNSRGPLRILQIPGYLVQRITTIEPDELQLDVAVTALRLALPQPQPAEQAPAPSPPLPSS